MLRAGTFGRAVLADRRLLAQGLGRSVFVRARAKPACPIRLPPRLGQPAHVLAEQPRGIDQRGERHEVASSGVQAQQVEPDPL